MVNMLLKSRKIVDDINIIILLETNLDVQVFYFNIGLIQSIYELYFSAIV
jgi:hypothetical protein